MSALTTLALVLGPVIGRVILRSWLDDGDIAEELTTSISKIVEAKTGDIIAQRRASREFEAIGERIAETLFPIFEADNVHLTRERKDAVIQAVTETLNKANITAALLATLNIDALKLNNYLVSNFAVEGNLDEPELDLYYRVIKECCNYIVETAGGLPKFTEKTLEAILKRENELLEYVIKLIKEVKKMRETSEKWNQTVSGAYFETEYLRTIVQKLDELELIGVDVSRSTRKHPLNVAYVTLSVEQSKKNKDEENTLLSVDDALAESRHILVRGLAGSGKTTLLKWIAVQAASRRFNGVLSDWNKLVPFFIRLRYFADRKSLPAPEQFPELMASTISDLMPRGWVHEQLQTGRAIVLIDGIDEIPIDQRAQVKNWIQELIYSFPFARIIVTSRPSAVEEGWLSTNDFADAHLQPMSLPNIYKFIEQWHQSVASVEINVEERLKLDSLAKNLKFLLKNDSSSLRSLAQTPLLCAMICALHRERRRHLPSDRAELYEACSRMLLERRDKERGIKIGSFPLMEYRLKKHFMQGLSYWMLQNGWSEVKLSDVDQHFNTHLSRMGNQLKGLSGFIIRQYFIERSGMLRLLNSEQIVYVHRTFQEYYAAQEALDFGSIGVLIHKVNDYQWREVILLAANLANQKQADELIGGILKEANRSSFLGLGALDESSRREVFILAAMCANVAISVNQNHLEEIHRNLQNIIPPQSYEEARVLASAAPLVTPLLQCRKKYNEKDSLNCIYLLSLVATPQAFEILQTYTTKPCSPMLISQLLSIWEAFEPIASNKQYVDLILKKSGIENAKALQVTYLGALSRASRYVKLRKLEKLIVTRARSNQDIEILGTLTNLTDLILRGNSQITSLDSLGKLQKLQYLFLSNMSSVHDMEPLGRLTSLTKLKIREGSKIVDLSPLARLENLKEIDFEGDGTSQKNLGFVVENAPSLQTITISGIKRKVKDLIKRREAGIDVDSWFSEF